MANVPVITEPDWDGKTPYSRSEAILLSIINGTPIDTEKWEGIPLSRGEYLLLQLKDVIEDNSMLDFKGRVDSVEDLPSTGNKKGDVYSVGQESQLNRPEYFWTGTSWEYFGQIVDLSGYATLQEVQTAINAAVNSLTAMVEGTYLPLTGGEIYYINGISDSGRIYFKNPDGYRTGSIGRGTNGSNTDLCLETYGKSLELVNTGNHLYVDSKTGPLDVVSRLSPLTINSEKAPLYLQYAGNSVMTVQSPNRVILNTYQNAAKIDMNAGIIEFVTDSGPFTKMDNTANAKHWTAGIGSTTYIDLDDNLGKVVVNKRLKDNSGVDTTNIALVYESSGTETAIAQIFATNNTMMLAAVGNNNTAVYGNNVSLNGTSVTINGPTTFNGNIVLSSLTLVQNNAYAGAISATQDGISVSSSGFSVSSAQTNILGGTTSISSTNVAITSYNVTLNNNPLRATVLLTQAEYDALTTKDPNVVYNIYEPDEEEGE